MAPCHLVVGLGNPGKEYQVTRHNAGFMLADKLAVRWHAAWVFEKKFQARVARAEAHGQKLILCEPQTYMNLSGEAVAALTKYFQIPLSCVLLLVDDADLPLGEIRLRSSGSSGGHHGLESIEKHFGSREFARLRLGIGRQETAGREIRDFVLGRFTADEQLVFNKVIARASSQVECWMSAGIQLAMTRFNGVIKTTQIKEPE